MNNVSRLPLLPMEASMHNSATGDPVTNVAKVVASIVEGIVIGVSS